MNRIKRKRESGFSLVEILAAITVVAILTALSVKPLNSWYHRLNAKKAGDGLKHYLVMVRSRAIANPARHCGVSFKLHPSNSKLDDSVIAFFDKVPTNNSYDPGVDSLYSSPFVLKKKERLSAAIFSPPYPYDIVFRGDGSANAGLQVVLTQIPITMTLDVLPSTGRIKMVMK
ncbi:MAG: type II secretion system protein [Fibrobacteria bacterium]